MQIYSETVPGLNATNFLKVREKVLDADLYEWYGSAAISEYLKVAKKIGKSTF